MKTVDVTDSAAIRAAYRGIESFTLRLVDGSQATVRPAPLMAEVLAPEQIAIVEANSARGDYRTMTLIESDPEVARPDHGGTGLYDTEWVFVANRLEESALIVAVFARED
jgi:hypothetical protein